MKYTVKKSSSKESKTVTQIKHQSSAISDYSSVKDIPNFTKELQISLVPDFHANRFQSPVQVRPKMTRVINGLKRSNALTSYDQNLQNWRTSPDLFQNNISNEFSGTWPKSGIMLHGRVYPLQMLELATREKDYLYWPTPTVCGNHNKKGLSKTSGDGLATAVKKMFPTPTRQDGENNGGASQYKRNSIPLNAIVKENELPEAQLNPDWEEWLMGWPIGWSDIKPLKELIQYNISIDPSPKIQRVTTLKKNRTKRLKAIGNGQVPVQVATAFNILYEVYKILK